MDLNSIAGLLAIFFGGGAFATIIGYFVHYTPKRDKARADARKAQADAEEIEGKNYRALIETLQAQYILLSNRLTHLEERVAILERMYQIGRALVCDLFGDLKLFGGIIADRGDPLPFDPEGRYEERVAEHLVDDAA